MILKDMDFMLIEEHSFFLYLEETIEEDPMRVEQ